MKTISIRLEDSIYEELDDLLDAMGQTKQTFYETYTRTVLRERCIPFIISAPAPREDDRKLDAFKRLEAYRKKSLEQGDYEKERTEAITEKLGDFKSHKHYTHNYTKKYKESLDRIARIVYYHIQASK